MKRILSAALLGLSLAACTSGTKTSTGRTERETDSVIGQSQVPGAPVVKKAMAASDSARARVAVEDSMAAGQ
ncbi:MAG: hypothetical protein ABI742_11035 [Gemmatimonadota bacterium]